MSEPVTAPYPAPRRSFAVVTAVLSLFGLGLFLLTHPTTPPGPVDASALLPPVYTLVGLVFAMWLLMGSARNLMVFMGRASIAYYEDYRVDVPADWIERPARVYNNLLQLPQLFYAAVLIMLWQGRVDAIQVVLCWLFVGLRILHALIFLIWNHVPSRFCAFAASSIALWVLWARIALGL